jgi:hypothetical protein
MRSSALDQALSSGRDESVPADYANGNKRRRTDSSHRNEIFQHSDRFDYGGSRSSRNDTQRSNRVDYGTSNGYRSNQNHEDYGYNNSRREDYRSEFIDYGGNRQVNRSNEREDRRRAEKRVDRKRDEKREISRRDENRLSTSGKMDSTGTDLEVSFGPTFEEASRYVSKCFSETGHINRNHRSAEGEHFAHSDTDLVRGLDVRNGTIVMVVQKRWEGRGGMDVDSAARKSTNFLFAEVVGEPRETTRFKTIGFMRPKVFNPLFVVSDYFYVRTQGYYLLPKGAIALGVDMLKASLKTTSVASEKAGALISAGKNVESIKGCYLITLDNQHIFTQDKTNTVARQNALKAVWRLAMERIHLIAPDQTIESDQYMRFLKEASEEEQPPGSLLEPAGLLCNISHLNLLKDKSLFGKFLQCEFEGLADGKLSLTFFNVAMKYLDKKPSLQGRMIIAEGFSYLELALRGIFHDRFHHIFDTIIENLEGVVTLYKRVANDFLVHTSEKTLTGWSRVIRTQHRSLLYPDIDLQSVQGCITLLKQMLEAALQRISGLEAVALDKEYRDREEQQSTPQIPQLIKSKSSTQGVVMTSNTCTHWFAGGLKVEDKKGGFVKCTNPKGTCSRTHVTPSTVTKAEAMRWNSSISLKEYKQRIAEKIELFDRFVE